MKTKIIFIKKNSFPFISGTVNFTKNKERKNNTIQKVPLHIQVHTNPIIKHQYTSSQNEPKPRKQQNFPSSLSPK
jgi:hypothetical protein